MPDITVSANVNSILSSANYAAIRTLLGLGDLSIVTGGTGVATALAINTGSAGAIVLFNGAGGTPTSLVGTNITGTAAGLTAGIASAVALAGITGFGANIATALAIAVGNTGAPILFNGAAGTPTSLVLTNATGAVTATYGNGSVTLAKIANAAANNKLLGSGASGSGSPYAEITLGTNLSISGTTLNASGGSGGGNVTGPGSSTDLAIAIYDGTTGQLLKNSLVKIDASGNILAGGGSTSNCAFSFSAEPSSGVFQVTAGIIGISAGGTQVASFAISGHIFAGPLTITSASSLVLGTAGSNVGSIGFKNATSGTATLIPPTGALGTYNVTLPNAASILPIFGQQITFAGPTTARTVTLPDASFTVARTDAANTFTGTQTIGALVATTLNGNTFTAGTYTLTGVAGKTLTFSNTLTFAGTDGTTMTFPGTSATIARTDAANTFTGTQTFGVVVGTSWNGNTWATGTGTLSIAAGKTFTSSNSITLTGTDSTSFAMPPASANIGYLEVPQNSQSTAYTAVLADSGKSIDHPSTDANARTFTIPANSSVAYPIGTCLTFTNMTSQVVTIAITTDTMNLAGAGTTGSRSLAQYGVATARKVASTVWLISGVGLT